MGLGLEALATLETGVGPHTGVNQEMFLQMVFVTEINQYSDHIS